MPSPQLKPALKLKPSRWRSRSPPSSRRRSSRASRSLKLRRSRPNVFIIWCPPRSSPCVLRQTSTRPRRKRSRRSRAQPASTAGWPSFPTKVSRRATAVSSGQTAASSATTPQRHRRLTRWSPVISRPAICPPHRLLETTAMSDDDTKVPLPDLENGSDVQVVQDAGTLAPSDSEPVDRGAADLEAVFDVPVQVSAVLGRAHMEVGNLLKLGPGAVLELDRKVGEAIDIYVNNRLVARGEVVLVEDKLGVTMTEIIKADHN